MFVWTGCENVSPNIVGGLRYGATPWCGATSFEPGNSRENVIYMDYCTVEISLKGNLVWHFRSVHSYVVEILIKNTIYTSVADNALKLERRGNRGWLAKRLNHDMVGVHKYIDQHHQEVRHALLYFVGGYARLFFFNYLESTDRKSVV